MLDFNKWKALSNGSTLEVRSQLLQVRGKAFSLEVISQDGEVLNLPPSDEIRIRIGRGSSVKATIEQGGFAYIYQPTNPIYRSEGAILTNLDKRPHESGLLAQLTLESRRKALENKAMARSIQAEMDQRAAAMRAEAQMIWDDLEAARAAKAALEAQAEPPAPSA